MKDTTLTVLHTLEKQKIKLKLMQLTKLKNMLKKEYKKDFEIIQAIAPIKDGLVIHIHNDDAINTKYYEAESKVISLALQAAAEI